MNIITKLAENINNWLIKKGFNPLQSLDSNECKFNFPGMGIILTATENDLINKLFSIGEEIEAATKKVLSDLGYGGAYEDALADVEEFWTEYFAQKKHKMTSKESAKLQSLLKRVYALRADADRADADLCDRRKEWMQMHPLSEAKFAQYAPIIGVKPDTIEYQHARLMTPAALVSRLNRQCSAEAREQRLMDEESEINRDDWFDFDVKHQTTLEKDKKQDETWYDQIMAKIAKEFIWAGATEESTFYEIGLLLAQYIDTLWIGDICKERVEKVLGDYDKEFQRNIINQLLADRLWEYDMLCRQREVWRDSVAGGKVPSWEYDLWNLGFGRQKNIYWKELGGRYNSIWGCLLKFESVKTLSDEYLSKIQQVSKYSEYKELKNDLFRNYCIRKKADNETELKAKFLIKAVSIMATDDIKFAKALVKVEKCVIPQDTYNPAWGRALFENIETAKKTISEYTDKVKEEIIVDHKYSLLNDFYGEERETMAIECLREIGKQARAAAEAQRAAIGNAPVFDTVESEVCDF